MSEHTHHDDHGHGHEQEPSKLHGGYFEIPIMLGGLFWALIIGIVMMINSSNCCEEGGACCDDGGDCCKKTEAHTSGGEHH